MTTAAASLETTQTIGWRWKLFLALVALAVIALTSLQIFLTNYEPLERGNLSSQPRGAFMIETLGTYPEPDSLAQIDLVEGEPVSFGFSIANNGPLPITIDSITQPFVPQMEASGVEITRIDWNTHPNVQTEPFVATAIPAGEQRVVRFSYIGGKCDLKRGDTIAFSDIPIRYSTLWSSKTTELPLPMRIVIKGNGTDCRVEP